MSDCELASCELVRAVPDVTDVRVSPSSGITELCDVHLVALIGNLWNRSNFLSPESVHIVVQIRRRDEVRRLFSENTPASRRRMTRPHLCKIRIPPV